MTEDETVLSIGRQGMKNGRAIFNILSHLSSKIEFLFKSVEETPRLCNIYVAKSQRIFITETSVTVPLGGWIILKQIQIYASMAHVPN